MQCVTSHGVTVDIDTDVLNDMEFLDKLAEMQNGDPFAMSVVATTLLGKEQKKAVYDSIRTEKGNVPIEAFIAEITRIFNAIGGTNAKKS